MTALGLFLLLCFAGGILLRDSSWTRRNAFLLTLIGALVVLYYFFNQL